MNIYNFAHFIPAEYAKNVHKNIGNWIIISKHVVNDRIPNMPTSSIKGVIGDKRVTNNNRI